MASIDGQRSWTTKNVYELKINDLTEDLQHILLDAS